MRPHASTFTALAILLLAADAAATQPRLVRGLSFTRDHHGTPTRLDVMPSGLVARLAPGTGAASVEVDLGERGIVELLPVGEVRDAWTDGPTLTEAVEGSLELELSNGEVLVFDGTVRPDGATAWTAEDPAGATISIDTFDADTAAGSTAFGLTFAGDALDDIVMADLVLAVPFGEPVCDIASRLGCLEWGPRQVELRRHRLGLGGTVTQMASAIQYAGEQRQSAEVVVRGGSGAVLEAFDTELWRPWDDGAGGQMAVAVDGPHPMQVSVVRGPQGGPRLAVVSEGWTDDGPAPAAVIVDLGSAGTVSAAPTMVHAEGVLERVAVPPGATIERDIDRGGWTGTDVGAGDGYLCDGDGICLMVVGGVDGDELLVTAFAGSSAELPALVSLPLLLHTEDGATDSFDVEVDFRGGDRTVTAFFDLFVGDESIEGTWGARVTVRGGASGRAAQGPVLVAPRTAFFGSEGYRVRTVRTAVTSGENNVGTAPPGVVLGAGVQLDPARGATEPYPVPVILYGNGSGTKAASSQTSAKPQLL